MRFVLIIVLGLLAACGPKPGARISYRDAGLSIYSNAVFDPARLQGDWVQVAGFQRPNGATCAGGNASFGAPDAIGRMRLKTSLCLSGQVARFDGYVDPVASGRFALSGADPQGIGQVWWVLWADIDDRTLLIGTPSGDFGFVLNRGAQVPVDRLQAAREILDFNGYDLTRLKVF
jgi:apolipoprotein D and lipocalin family protein